MGRGLHYNIYKDKSYFLTMTVVDWVDLFTRLTQKQLIIDSLKYCQENKGLNIFGWCLMPSHLHLIANTKIPFDLDNVVKVDEYPPLKNNPPAGGNGRVGKDIST